MTKNSGSQYGVSLTSDETDIFVNCEYNSTFEIKVENNGDDNDWEKIELSTELNKDNWNASLNETILILKSGESRNVALNIKAPLNGSLSEQAFIRIKVKVSDGSEGPPKYPFEDSVSTYATINKSILIQQTDILLSSNKMIVTDFANKDSLGKILGPAEIGTTIEVIVSSNKPIDILFFDTRDYNLFQEVFNNGKGKISFYYNASYFNTKSEKFIFTFPKGDIYYLVLDNTDMPDGGVNVQEGVVVQYSIYETYIPEGEEYIFALKDSGSYGESENKESSFQLLFQSKTFVFVLLIIGIVSIALIIREKKSEEFSKKHLQVYRFVNERYQHTNYSSYQTTSNQPLMQPPIKQYYSKQTTIPSQFPSQIQVCAFCNNHVPMELKFCNICGEEIKN